MLLHTLMAKSYGYNSHFLSRPRRFGNSLLVSTLEAVFGALVSILFYHEVVTARVALGFGLIFAAVVMNELRPFRGKKLA